MFDDSQSTIHPKEKRGNEAKVKPTLGVIHISESAVIELADDVNEIHQNLGVTRTECRT